MYSFYIDNDDTKVFMNKLFKEDSFDKFYIRTCDVKTFVTFNIDASLNKDWLEEETDKTYCKWADLKPYVVNMIKGSKKPSYFKIVMSLSEKATATLHPNGQACFLNILFEFDKVTIITGTAQREFSLDKSLDDTWDNKVKDFFKKLGITQNIEE